MQIILLPIHTLQLDEIGRYGDDAQHLDSPTPNDVESHDITATQNHPTLQHR